MTSLRFVLVLAILAVASLACSQGEPKGEAAAEKASGNPAASETHDPVTYEPAYPVEVSADGLTEEDVEQQESSHSHGDGEAHAHGEEEHSHDAAQPGQGEPHDEAGHDH